MKAVVIGSGLIGCGLVGQVLQASGHQIVFVARNQTMVDHLNRMGHYRVSLVKGLERQESVVEGIRAVSTAEPERVAEEIADAGLVVTAVGAGNLPQVAPLIAAGLRQRSAPVNVLAFENLADAGPYLRQLVDEQLPADFSLAAHGFSGALIDRVVSRRLGNPGRDEPLTFIGDPPATFVVDGQSLRQPLPAIEGMIVADDYNAWIRRKLYTFSAGHATCAYLGYLKGYHYIHSAIRDPEIRNTVLRAMTEGQAGLAARYGETIAGNRSNLDDIISRFENAALNDPIARVGRDPQRKLGAEDRLVGAARLAEEAGVYPKNLALAAAAAFYFYDPADPSAISLRREVKEAGPGSILDRVSHLDPSQGLGRFVSDIWQRLARGWQNDNLLLSLNKLQWAWQV
jgi:mannitol-1-phosphate 5-dehydrogenase